MDCRFVPAFVLRRGLIPGAMAAVVVFQALVVADVFQVPIVAALLLAWAAPGA